MTEAHFERLLERQSEAVRQTELKLREQRRELQNIRAQYVAFITKQEERYVEVGA